MYRLLIADDEMIERKVLHKTIQKNLGKQCTVFQAENGREALEIFEEEKIQIVIMDIEMPGINGIEAARKIREKDKSCSIIFLTAFDEFSYARNAIQVRALDYLLKPYSEQELMLVLEEAMHLVDEQNKKSDSDQRLAIPETGKSEPAEEDEKPGNPRISQMIFNYIEKNYANDISMQDLAREMNYSEAYFSKLFKQYFGQNFTSYLMEYRVNEAKRLLGEHTINVKEIGKSVGYGDSNYFAKVFKRVTGQSPTEYRSDLFRRG